MQVRWLRPFDPNVAGNGCAATYVLKKAETEIEPQPLANKQASVADKWTLEE